MEVKEMTISDVLKTPAFYNNLKELFVKCLDNEKKRDNSNGDD